MKNYIKNYFERKTRERQILGKPISYYIDNIKNEAEAGRIDLIKNFCSLLNIKIKRDKSITDFEKRNYSKKAEEYLREGHKRWIGTALYVLANPYGSYGYYEDTYRTSSSEIMETAKKIGMEIEAEEIINKIRNKDKELEGLINQEFGLAKMFPKEPLKSFHIPL